MQKSLEEFTLKRFDKKLNRGICFHFVEGANVSLAKFRRKNFLKRHVLLKRFIDLCKENAFLMEIF